MTAVTPKGERRRYALISAAAELLREGGFDAVRHRAVAQRAGLPLASTTYYFSSLEDLIAHAVEHIGMLEVAQLRARITELSRRRRSAETTADILVELLVGEGSDEQIDEQLISRYERYIVCSRHPALRGIFEGATRIVMLDETGETPGSKAFAERLSRWRDDGVRECRFLIGAADGFDDAERANADMLISFGRLTWPHMLARAMLAEQLWRATSILAGHPYHREG